MKSIDLGACHHPIYVESDYVSP